MKPNKNIIILIIAIILFILSLFFDSQIFGFIQSIRCPIADTFFSWLLIIEKDLVFYPLVIFATLVILSIRNRKNALPYLLGLVAAGVLTLVLKVVFARSRPNGLDELSFPSGHTVLLTTSIPFLNNKTVRIVWIILSCVFLSARLWLGLHYLSDIIAGAIIGYFIPMMICRLITIKVMKKKRK
ncbi:MAG: phosphatase PAP2 family protein [Candidatus Pacearchaeota archaeon]